MHGGVKAEQGQRGKQGTKTRSAVLRLTISRMLTVAEWTRIGQEGIKLTTKMSFTKGRS